MKGYERGKSFSDIGNYKINILLVLLEEVNFGRNLLMVIIYKVKFELVYK